jgi:hypothetical protein
VTTDDLALLLERAVNDSGAEVHIEGRRSPDRFGHQFKVGTPDNALLVLVVELDDDGYDEEDNDA